MTQCLELHIKFTLGWDFKALWGPYRCQPLVLSAFVLGEKPVALFLRKSCLGRIALSPVRGMSSIKTCLLSFCSLPAFPATSNGQSKNGHTQTSVPQQRNHSLLSSLNSPGQKASVSVCTIENCSLLQCMPTVTFSEIVLGTLAYPYPL